MIEKQENINLYFECGLIWSSNASNDLMLYWDLSPLFMPWKTVHKIKLMLTWHVECCLRSGAFLPSCGDSDIWSCMLMLQCRPKRCRQTHTKYLILKIKVCINKTINSQINVFKFSHFLKYCAFPQHNPFSQPIIRICFHYILSLPVWVVDIQPLCVLRPSSVLFPLPPRSPLNLSVYLCQPDPFTITVLTVFFHLAHYSVIICLVSPHKAKVSSSNSSLRIVSHIQIQTSHFTCVFQFLAAISCAKLLLMTNNYISKTTKILSWPCGKCIQMRICIIFFLLVFFSFPQVKLVFILKVVLSLQFVILSMLDETSKMLYSNQIAQISQEGLCVFLAAPSNLRVLGAGAYLYAGPQGKYQESEHSNHVHMMLQDSITWQFWTVAWNWIA